MNDIISVPLPINLNADELDLYESYQTYESPVQKIRIFKNVFITFSGFCMNNKGLIKECHHNYPVQYNYYLNESSVYYYNVTDHPENLITLDNDTVYLAVHHPWFNYYHWICESIFRLWLVRKKLNKLTLILPEYYKYADFITGSLEPFNLKNIFYIPNGKSLLVKNLCLPQIKPLCDSYNRFHLKQVRDFYISYVSKQVRINSEESEKLYISRQLAVRRKVINEAEILEIVSKHGFIIFHPEKHSFLEQVAIFSQVKYVIGAHGSGLTNMLFMQKGTSVLELHKNKTNELNHPSFLFWYMAEALEINYYHQSCNTFGREDYFEGDYIIDAKLFEQNLITMISNKIL